MIYYYIIATGILSSNAVPPSLSVCKPMGERGLSHMPYLPPSCLPTRWLTIYFERRI